MEIKLVLKYCEIKKCTNSFKAPKNDKITTCSNFCREQIGNRKRRGGYKNTFSPKDRRLEKLKVEDC